MLKGYIKNCPNSLEPRDPYRTHRPLYPRCHSSRSRLVHEAMPYAPPGPLQPLGVRDQQLLANLKAHVVAVASEEHNVGHPEALERSARYIEARLSRLGLRRLRQEFETEGVRVRNLEVRRTARVRERRGSS